MKQKELDYVLAAIRAASGNPSCSRILNTGLLHDAALSIGRMLGIMPGTYLERPCTGCLQFCIYRVKDIKVAWEKESPTILSITAEAIENSGDNTYFHVKNIELPYQRINEWEMTISKGEVWEELMERIREDARRADERRKEVEALVE